MERSNVVVIFSWLIIVLLTSGTYQNKVGSDFYCYTLCEIEQDTTGLIHLIEIDSFNLKIFPPSSGVQFYKDGIVFLSRSKNERKMVTIHTSFGTIEAYYAIPEDTVLGKQMIFSQSPAFSFPTEGVTFSPDFQTMYFSKIPLKDTKEKIYFAKFFFRGQKKSGWLSEKMPLDFCTGNFSYSHPSISDDENILIFASDKEDSYGGMDLYITRKEGNNWLAPENLGQIINTSGNEFFPFLDSDNNLFFSSDGLVGYGGYDIFTSKFNGETWDRPQNLSNRINSKDDDIAFTINKTDGKTAFYTNRQKSGNAEMQLLKVTLDKEIAESNLLTISYIFNGEPVLKPNLTTEKTIAEVTGKNRRIITPENINQPEEKKEVVEIPVPKSDPPVSEKPLNPVPVKVDTGREVSPEINDNKDVVVYRVQFLSTTTSKGKFSITVVRKSYDTYEYFYKGAFRHTAGEFSTFREAIELKNGCRQSGYSQAFVVAFKNNVRSLDPVLFK